MKKALVIGLGLAACSMASASSLFVSGFSAGKFRFVLTSFNGGSPLTNTQAGALDATLDGSQSFEAYCVDALHAPLIGSSYPVSTVQLPNAGLANSGRLAFLYQNFASSVNNQDTGAGLQLAIWDVLMDNGDGLSAGLFRASTVTSTVNQTNAYLAASVGQSGSATWYKGTPGANQPQDLIGANPVPEPATIVTLGIAAAAVLRRRRKA
jgi:hypothetical protein